MNLTNLILVPWLVFILWWAAAATRVKRDLVRGWRRHLTGIRLALLVAFIALLRLNPVLRRFATPRAANVAGWISGLAIPGILLCWAGIALAIWARIHLAGNWSARPSLKENHELVTTGPYRRVRHPIYAGIILAFFGSMLAQGGVWLVFFPIALGVFIHRIGVEEGLMLQTFPHQYPEYEARTSALIPSVF